jgi:hypothetical protein
MPKHMPCHTQMSSPEKEAIVEVFWIVGVPLAQILNRLLALKLFLGRLRGAPGVLVMASRAGEPHEGFLPHGIRLMRGNVAGTTWDCPLNVSRHDITD